MILFKPEDAFRIAEDYMNREEYFKALAFYNETALSMDSLDPMYKVIRLRANKAKKKS